MAIDKAIDSAKEAACRTAEANAIREKLGSSDPISYDFTGGQGFAAAIAQIPQGEDVELLTLTGVTPSESGNQIDAPEGYAYNRVEVNAIPGNYIGSRVPIRGENDITVYGAMVTVPAGYYSLDYGKSVQIRMAPTPTATKGSVSGHSVAVTPKVTYYEGYITQDQTGEKTGTPVIVTAAELVSGNKAITAGTSTQTGIDVKNYETVSVAPTPSEEKTVTQNGAVTPSAGKLLSKVTVNVPTGGGATEPYIEETYDTDGNLTGAVLHGYTKVRNYAYYECTSLALTSLPSGLTSIGNYAFAACTSLALTSLPSSLTSIGEFAFERAANVTVQAIPAGVTTIGSRAFGRCLGLTQMRFYGTPTSIAKNTFYNCTNLTDIYVPWEDGDVAGAPWGATNATVHYAGEENA